MFTLIVYTKIRHFIQRFIYLKQNKTGALIIWSCNQNKVITLLLKIVRMLYLFINYESFVEYVESYREAKLVHYNINLYNLFTDTLDLSLYKSNRGIDIGKINYFKFFTL